MADVALENARGALADARREEQRQRERAMSVNDWHFGVVPAIERRRLAEAKVKELEQERALKAAPETKSPPAAGWQQVDLYSA